MSLNMFVEVLSIEVICFNVSCNLSLPLITIVQQLLVGLCGELKVGALHDGVDGAGLLAEAAVDALGHVNVVSGGSPGAVTPLFSLNSDCLGGTDGLTELAGNASLFPTGVPSQCVLPTEPWGQGS